MRAFWELVERLDRTAWAATAKVEKLRQQDSYRARIERSMEHVRPPQRAIQFDN